MKAPPIDLSWYHVSKYLEGNPVAVPTPEEFRHYIEYLKEIHESQIKEFVDELEDFITLKEILHKL